jgi:hypothetical protein
MRRGLIAWSKDELPESVLETRVARAQEAMARAGVDALLVYTNHTRPAAVSWLTGFVPYWSEGALVLPREGRPRLVTALSKRVHDWIERTALLGEVVSAPRLGAGAARLIADAKPEAVVAVVELDGIPDRLIADLRANASGITIVDAETRLGVLHVQADAAERELALRSSAIAQRALDEVSLDPPADAIVAAVEYAARSAGAEEVYVAVAPDVDRDRRLIRLNAAGTVLGATFAVRASVAYKGVWTRVVRTFSRDSARAASFPQAVHRLAEAARHLSSAGAFAGLPWWLVESSSGTQPLEPAMGSTLSSRRVPHPGSLVSLQALVAGDAGPVLVGAPAIVGSELGGGALLLESRSGW